MWEYLRKDINFSTYSELMRVLNVDGSNGWEIIHYSENNENRVASILYKRKTHQ